MSADDQPAASSPQLQQITRLVGVYDANGTIRGELAYWIGARLGRTHCSLCDITHGSVRERPEWKECRIGLPVTFDTYHRNDQPDAVRIVTRDMAPAVLAETSDGFVLLMDAPTLDGCSGSIESLIAGIEQSARRHGLTWPVVAG